MIVTQDTQSEPANPSLSSSSLSFHERRERVALESDTKGPQLGATIYVSMLLYPSVIRIIVTIVHRVK